MHKTSPHLLWIYPLVTQLIVSLFLPFFGGFNLSGLSYIFIFATIPAFLFALICYKQQYHQRNLVQIAFFSGTLMFLYSLIAFSLLLATEDPTTQEPISLWETSLAVIFYSLTFTLPSIVYAMVFLRLFLPKHNI